MGEKGWRQSVSDIYEEIHGPLPDPVATAGSKLITAPATPVVAWGIAGSDSGFIEQLHGRLKAFATCPCPPPPTPPSPSESIIAKPDPQFAALLRDRLESLTTCARGVDVDLLTPPEDFSSDSDGDESVYGSFKSYIVHQLQPVSDHYVKGEGGIDTISGRLGRRRRNICPTDERPHVHQHLQDCPSDAPQESSSNSDKASTEAPQALQEYTGGCLRKRPRKRLCQDEATSSPPLKRTRLDQQSSGGTTLPNQNLGVPLSHGSANSRRRTGATKDRLRHKQNDVDNEMAEELGSNATKR